MASTPSPVIIATSEYWGQAPTAMPAADHRRRHGEPGRRDHPHRVITSLFVDRGDVVDHTYQLNFGGNSYFKQLLERDRLESKNISKTGAVTSMLPYKLDPDDVHVGPTITCPG